MGIKTKSEFRQLFQTHYNVLCNYAYQIVKDYNRAEDVVQDVFIRLWKKREDIDADDNIQAYLAISVKHKALEFLRKRKNEQENLENMPIPLRTRDQADIEAEFNKLLLKEKLNKSIRQLPPKCQDIFVLSKLEGLTYDEIAELRKISKKTVENHIANALKILRKTLRSEP